MFFTFLNLTDKPGFLFFWFSLSYFKVLIIAQTVDVDKFRAESIYWMTQGPQFKFFFRKFTQSNHQAQGTALCCTRTTFHVAQCSHFRQRAVDACSVLLAAKERDVDRQKEAPTGNRQKSVNILEYFKLKRKITQLNVWTMKLKSRWHVLEAATPQQETPTACFQLFNGC